MEKEKDTKPAPDAVAASLAELRFAMVSLLVASLRRPRAPPPPPPLTEEEHRPCCSSLAPIRDLAWLRSEDLRNRAEIEAAQREFAAQRRVAGAELLLAIALAAGVLLLLIGVLKSTGGGEGV